MYENNIPSAANIMIEMYGKDAEIVALGTAQRLADQNHIEDAAAWQCVATMIAELGKK